MAIPKTATRLALLLLVSLLLSGSCGMGDPMTSISGVVTDSMSGSPIDSAVLQIKDTLSPALFYSDSLGKYTALRFGYGTFRLFCRKTVYQTKSTTVRSSKDNLTITGIDFQLVTQQDST